MADNIKILSTDEVITQTNEVTVDLSSPSLDPNIKNHYHKSYQDVLEEVFVAEMASVLKQLRLALKDTQFLVEGNLEEPLLSYLKQNEFEKNLSYEQAAALCKALELHLKNQMSQCNYQGEKNILLSSTKALGSLQPFYNYNIPKFVQNINQVVTMQESKHIVRRHRKSFWRKLIEFILPFLPKKEDREVIKLESKKLGSLNKAAAQRAGYKLIHDNTKDVKKHIEQLKAHSEAFQDANTIKVPIKPTDEKVELDGPSTTVKEVASIGTNILYRNALKHMDQQYSELPFMSSAVSYLLGDPSQPKESIETKTPSIEESAYEKDVATHLKEAFDNEVKRIAFESMISFVDQLYNVYNKLDNIDMTDPNLKLNTKELNSQLGCHFLTDPEFKIMIINMSHALGFRELENKSPQDIIKRLASSNLNPKIKEAAFKKFMDEQEKGVGIGHLYDHLAQEYKRTIQSSANEKKLSSQYHHLVDMNYQIINKLKAASSQENLIIEGLKLSGVEEQYFNPQGTGFIANMSHDIRAAIIEKVPVIIHKQLSSVKRLEKETLISTKRYLQSIDNYLENLQINTTTLNPDTQNEERWLRADSSVKKALETLPKTTVTRDPIIKIAEKKWQEHAGLVILNVMKLGKKPLLDKLKQTIEQQIVELEENQAHPNIIARKKVQLKALSAPNITKSNELEFNEFLILYNAIHQSIQAIDEKGLFENSVEQRDVYMMKTALDQTKSAHVIPEMILNVKNTLSAKFGKNNFQEPNIITKFIIDQGEKMWLQHASGIANTQLSYYVNQRNVDKRIMEAPQGMRVSEVKKAQDSGWLSTAASYASTAAKYATHAAITVYHVTDIAVTARFNQDMQEEYDSPESLNKALVDSANICIREQTFDAAVHMANQMYIMQTVISRFKKSNPNIHINPYEEFGFCNEAHFNEFLNKLATGLGYEDAAHLAYREASDEHQIKKQAFTKLRVSDIDRALDPFVSLKAIIQNENTFLSNNLGKRGYKNAQNFLVMVSSMNALISKIQTVQQHTVAVDLFAPDIAKTLNLSNENNNYWQHLKNVAAQKAKDPLLDMANQGILSYLQSSIATNEQMTTGMLKENIDRLTEYLDEILRKEKQTNELATIHMKTKDDVANFIQSNDKLLNAALEDVIPYAFAKGNIEFLSLIFNSDVIPKEKLSAYVDYLTNRNQDTDLVQMQLLSLMTHVDLDRLDDVNTIKLTKICEEMKPSQAVLEQYLQNYVINSMPVQASQAGNVKHNQMSKMSDVGLSESFISTTLEQFVFNNNEQNKSPEQQTIITECLKQTKILPNLYFEPLSPVEQSSAQWMGSWVTNSADNDRPKLESIKSFFGKMQTQQQNIMRNIFNTFENKLYWPIQNLQYQHMSLQESAQQIIDLEKQLLKQQAQIELLKKKKEGVELYQDEWITLNAPISKFDNGERWLKHIELWKNEVSWEPTLQEMQDKLNESKDELNRFKEEIKTELKEQQAIKTKPKSVVQSRDPESNKEAQSKAAKTNISDSQNNPRHKKPS